MPELTGVLETALYVEDTERSARFYEETFGFRRLANDYRLCALSVADRQVLLLFKRGASRQHLNISGGVIPSHDGRGEQHFALAVPRAALPEWEAKLAAKGIPLESRVRWELGGESIYFRDPDGHSVELATPGIWPIY